MVLSCLKKEGVVPIANLTLGEILNNLSEKTIEYVMLEDGSRFSAQDVCTKARSYAKGMLALGLTRQDRVMSVGIISVEAVALLAASLSVGVAYAHPTIYKPREASLKDIIERLNPKLLFVGEGMKGDGLDSLKSLITKDNKIFPSVKEIFYDGSINGRPQGEGLGKQLPELITIGEKVTDKMLADASKSILTSDAAFITTSSGSTGKPKIMSYSHYTVANMYSQNIGRGFDKIAVSLSGPSTADFSFYLAILFGILAGHRKVVVTADLDEERLSDQIKELAKAINDEQINCNFVMRGFAAGLLQLVKNHGYSFPSLKMQAFGSQVVSPRFLEDVYLTLKLLPVNSYGMTEVGGAIALSSLDVKPGDNLQQKFLQLHLRDHIELMIVDDNGQPVERGTEGEIWIKSGYGIVDFISPPMKSSDVLSDDGFFKSGDVGVMNDNDTIEVKGRKSDSLRFKTHQRVVWPGKIEDALVAHPSISKASVISMGDNEFYGAEITCCICVEENCEKPSEEDIISHIVEHADNLSRPCRIVFMERLPYTVNGRKVDKNRLKLDVEKMIVEDINYGTTQWYKDLLRQYKG